MNLIIRKKAFSFSLNKALKTSQGFLTQKKGWLIKVKDTTGKVGWGEVSPIDQKELIKCNQIINNIKSDMTRNELESQIKDWPKPIGFGMGAALAEIDCKVGKGSKEGWLNAPKSSILLDSNDSIMDQVNFIINQNRAKNTTIKLKVGVKSNKSEEALVEKILCLLPIHSKLRLDVNEGWELNQAEDWAYKFKKEPKLEWIEQPLPAENIEGLFKLSKIISIALDESLVHDFSLIKSWRDWQIRRPVLEGDPRLLLEELKQGAKFRSLSTTFETGIGKRWLHHLAALQSQGPTPTAPGLGPGWTPKTALFSKNPEIVWESV